MLFVAASGRKLVDAVLGILVSAQSNTQEAVRGIVDACENTGGIPIMTQLERGEQVMDAMRVTVHRMEGAEKRLLEHRTQQPRLLSISQVGSSRSGTLVGPLSLFIAGIAPTRSDL
jgi:hypothetical protein